MDKILLLNPPAPGLFIRDYYCSFESKADYYWPPQDLLVLSGLLSKKKIYVIDAIVEKTTPDGIAAFILNHQIDWVIFATGTATLKYDIETMAILKAKTGVFTVASSGILKYDLDRFFKNFPTLDAALLDFTDPQIAEFVEDPYKKQWNTIGVCQHDQIQKPKNVSEKTFSYPPPAHHLFPYKKYSIPIAKRNPFALVITTVGCPYRCRFCTIPDYGFRCRDVDNVIDELKQLKALGFAEILFQDPTFTVNTRHMTDLLNRMIAENLFFSFSCNVDINSMTEEKIDLLKRAGCHTVNIGLESGNEEILKRYRKAINLVKAAEIVKLFKKYHIQTLGYFIIGLPGESEETIEQTIDLARSLPLDFASFAIASPDLGSDLRREAIEEGWISAGDDFFDSTQNPVIDVPGLSKDKIIQLRNRAEKRFYFRFSYMLKRLRHVGEFRESIKNGLAMWRRIWSK